MLKFNDKLYPCTGCYRVSYCDKTCQQKYWKDHKKDWGILYNSQYNDTTKYWSFFEKLFKRLNEPLDLILECPKPKRERKKNVKTNNIRKR